MPYTTLELEAYLDKQLSPELMAQVVQALRGAQLIRLRTLVKNQELGEELFPELYQS